MKSGIAIPGRRPPAQPQQRVRLAVLCCIVASGYLLTFSGSRYGRVGDGKEMFATALSIYEFNELAIPNVDSPQSAQAEIHSRYGIGFPLLLQIPLFVADHLQSWFGMKSGDYLFPFTNLVLNLLTTLLIAASARRLQFGCRAAYGASLAFAFGSFAWPYISFDFSEPLQAFCLIFAFWALLRAFQHTRWQRAWLLLAGLSLGYAVLTKTLLVAAVPAFAAYLWLNSHGNFRQKFGMQVIFGIPLACGGAAVAILNYARYGSAAETGYGAGLLFTTPLWHGLYGLLIGPNKGLPMYAPFVVLLPLSCYWLYRYRRRELFFLCLLAGAIILPVAKWWSWEGGSSWGPRLLYPLLPFVMLFSVYVMEHWKAAWIPVALLLSFGVIINLMGVLFYFSTWGNICGANGDLVPLNAPGRLQREYQVKDNQRYFPPFIAANYLPSLNPVVGHAWMLRWRYFDIPFPMSSLLSQVPVSKVLYGPVTINFEKLAGMTRQRPAFYRELTSAELMIPAIMRSSGDYGAYPIRSKTYSDNGDRFVAKREFPRAYYAYRKAYDLGYDTLKLLPKLGGTCFSLGRIPEAEVYFDQYLSSFPRDQNVRLFYAQALETTGQYARSLEQYQQLQRTDWVSQRITALSHILQK